MRVNVIGFTKSTALILFYKINNVQCKFRSDYRFVRCVHCLFFHFQVVFVVLILCVYYVHLVVACISCKYAPLLFFLYEGNFLYRDSLVQIAIPTWFVSACPACRVVTEKQKHLSGHRPLAFASFLLKQGKSILGPESLNFSLVSVFSHWSVGFPNDMSSIGIGWNFLWRPFCLNLLFFLITGAVVCHVLSLPNINY